MLSSLVRNGARALRAAPAVQDAIGQQTRTLGASSARWYADAEIDLNKEQKREVSPKVQKLADEFCSLTLLEVADLTDILKERLGFQGVSMGMPMMGAPAAGGAAPAAADAAAAPAGDAKAAKTEFDVKLESFDAANKIKVIKEVRAATGLGLKEAKDLVEGVPAVVKKGLKKEEAEALKAKLAEAGAKVSVA